MGTEVDLNGKELLEVDICNRGVCSEDESGVFVNSASSLQEDFSGFQQWASPAPSPHRDTSSPPGEQSRSRAGSPPGDASRRAPTASDSDAECPEDGLRVPRSSIVDCLLVELYETYSGGGRRNVDSWDSSTEASGSDAFPSRSNSGSSFLQELQEKHTRRLQVNYLGQKAPEELQSIIQEVKYRTGLQSAKLIRQLRRRDRLCHKLQKNCDIITACLQAVSQKRRRSSSGYLDGSGQSDEVAGSSGSPMRQERLPAAVRRPRAGGRLRQRAQGSGGVGNIISNVLKKRNGISRSAPRLLCTLEPGVDTRLKFSIEPSLGKNGFQQWYDALKAVARLPTGIPKEWRKRVWLTLADQYLHSISIDWEKTLRFAFNERSNPDDDSLGIQIVKDLHRTGCSSYCGQEGEQDRVVLKRVLLAYARWNKTVGYCQGFNVLAALILEVTEGKESDALKVMIYLIDKVLPESYFANNLRALSVDMAVFRDILRLKLPRLSQHLHHLQKSANKEAGGSYEPPLTNVFTMQWFLTIFATCLPAPTVLKIWDSVFFEGSEMLFRVALAIWERLGERIEYCQTADEFYSTMGCLTQEMLEENLLDSAELMQEVYSMAVFPFPQLAELREKYTYNITPFPTSVKSNGSGGLGSWESDDDADMDDEDSMVTALGCLGPLGGLLAPELQRYQKHLKEQRVEQSNIGELSPGAVGATGPGGGGGGGGGGGARAEHKASINSMMMERMNTDIYALKKQYARIKRRQQQQAMHLYVRTGPGAEAAASTCALKERPDSREKSPDRQPDDKCPSTRVLPSQLNPSSTVINHLLVGRKPRASSSRYPSTDTSTPQGTHPGSVSQGQTSPARHHRGSLPSVGTGSPGSSRGGGGSPWRAHVRVHRRNVARARAQLGFGDSEEREDDEEVEKRSEEESPDPSGTGSTSEEVPQEPDEAGEAKVGEVVGQLEALDLEDINPETGPRPPEAAPVSHVPLLPRPPPSSRRLKESDSSGSEQSSSPNRHFPPAPLTPPDQSISPESSSTSPPSPAPSPVLATAQLRPSPSTPSSSSFYRTPSPSTPSLSSLSSSHMSPSPSTPAFPSSVAPKQQAFSPFPCMKQPRKSVAARNLGLYGPTSRTPTVHFPQLSRHLNRSSGAGTTGRR